MSVYLPASNQSGYYYYSGCYYMYKYDSIGYNNNDNGCAPYMSVNMNAVTQQSCCATNNCNSIPGTIDQAPYCENNSSMGANTPVFPIPSLNVPSTQTCYFCDKCQFPTKDAVIRNCTAAYSYLLSYQNTINHASCAVRLVQALKILIITIFNNCHATF